MSAIVEAPRVGLLRFGQAAAVPITSRVGHHAPRHEGVEPGRRDHEEEGKSIAC